MNEVVYVVFVEDRHTDVDVKIYRSFDNAAYFCLCYLAKMAVYYGLDRVLESIEENADIENFWTYSYEGDCIWITERELL